MKYAIKLLSHLFIAKLSFCWACFIITLNNLTPSPAYFGKVSKGNIMEKGLNYVQSMLAHHGKIFGTFFIAKLIFSWANVIITLNYLAPSPAHVGKVQYKYNFFVLNVMEFLLNVINGEWLEFWSEYIGLSW